MDDLIFRPNKDKLGEIHNKRKLNSNQIEYSEEQIQERINAELEVEEDMVLLRNRTMQEYLKQNISKATRIAEQNTTRNKDGIVVLSINDDWKED